MNLQAYNKQITQATVLVTDPASRPMIPDVDIPIRGGYRIPACGSGVPTTTVSQGSSPPPQQGSNYIFQTSTNPPAGLTLGEAQSTILQIILLGVIVFFPSVGMAMSDLTQAQQIFLPLLHALPILFLKGELFVNGAIGLVDMIFAIIGFIVSIITAAISYKLRDANFWTKVLAWIPFIGQTVSGAIGITFVAFFIGVIVIFIGFVWACLT